MNVWIPIVAPAMLQALECEKSENHRLREMLMEKDALIIDLRQEISLLHKVNVTFITLVHAP